MSSLSYVQLSMHLFSSMARKFSTIFSTRLSAGTGNTVRKSVLIQEVVVSEI